MVVVARRGEVYINYEGKRYSEEAFKTFYPTEYAKEFGV